MPPCTCWIPSPDSRACSVGTAAQRRSSTWREKSASSAPSGAATVPGGGWFGAVCAAESHGCGIRARCSLNTLWFLCSRKNPPPQSTYTFLQPRADNTTRYHVTLNPFSAVPFKRWFAASFPLTCCSGFYYINNYDNAGKRRSDCF